MNSLNVERLASELSAILSEKYGVQVTITATKKEETTDGNGLRKRS